MRRPGLLGNLANPISMMGLGLMGQGPSLTPISPMQGLGAGLGMYGALQQAQSSRQAQEMQAQKLAMQQQEAERKQAAMAGLSPELQQIAMLSPGTAAQTLAGQMAPPEEPELPSSVQTAMWLANASPEDRQAFMDMKAAGRPEGTRVNVKLPEARKPVGADAPKYVLPDGSTPGIDSTPAEIAAAGGRALTPSEQSARKKIADFEAGQALAQAKVDEALGAYNKALESDPFGLKPETKRLATEVAVRRGSLINAERELSGAMMKTQEPPSPIRRGIGELATGAMGELADLFGGGDAQAQAPAGPGAGPPLPADVDSLVNKWLAQ